MEKYLMAVIKNQKLSFEELEDNLKEYYRVIDTDMIEIIELKINKTTYDIILDEEGKLKNKYINVALTKNLKVIDVLVGHIIIQKHDYENDEPVSLTSEEQKGLTYWMSGCIKFIDIKNKAFIPTIEL